MKLSYMYIAPLCALLCTPTITAMSETKVPDRIWQEIFAHTRNQTYYPRKPYYQYCLAWVGHALEHNKISKFDTKNKNTCTFYQGKPASISVNSLAPSQEQTPYVAILENPQNNIIARILFSTYSTTATHKKTEEKVTWPICALLATNLGYCSEKNCPEDMQNNAELLEAIETFIKKENPDLKAIALDCGRLETDMFFYGLGFNEDENWSIEARFKSLK